MTIMHPLISYANACVNSEFNTGHVFFFYTKSQDLGICGQDLLPDNPSSYQQEPPVPWRRSIIDRESERIWCVKKLSSEVYSIHDSLRNIHVGMYHVCAKLWSIIVLCFEHIFAVSVNRLTCFSGSGLAFSLEPQKSSVWRTLIPAFGCLLRKTPNKRMSIHGLPPAPIYLLW